MKSKLSDICSYRKEKIAVAELDRGNYISTENMLPDKNGVTTATSLPTTIQTQKYAKGDILVSNIRPYFKKIWFADKNGGCSNDVLVFKTKEGTDPRYLYYVLANDPFFEYSMATAKGTKMPRGDKKALMEYEVPDYDLKEQNKIAGVLSAIDDKIQLNNKINKNLSEQLQALYTSEFDVTIHHATAKLSDICHYSVEKVNVDELSTKTYYSTENMQPNKVSSVEATNLPNIKQTTRCHKGDVLVSNIRPYFKKIEYVTTECGCSTDVLCFVPASKELSAFLYETLYADRFFDYMVAGSKGTKMPRGDKQQIMQYEVVMPSSEQLLAFNAAATPMLALITNGLLENERLSMLGDSLLPRLMAGELDVSDIDF